MKYLLLLILAFVKPAFAGDEALIIVNCIPELGITQITPVWVEFNYDGIPDSVKDKYTFLKKKYGIYPYPKDGKKIICKTINHKVEIISSREDFLSLKINDQVVMKGFTLGLSNLIGPSVSSITINREFLITVCGNIDIASIVCKEYGIETAIKSGIDVSQFDY